MKIIITYFKDGDVEDEHPAFADAMYKANSIENAEEALGKLGRYLENKKEFTQEVDF